MMFKNKIILISGGSGSWGHVLTEQLLKQEPKKIIIFSRGELAQVNMERKFMNDKIEFIIGDVRDTVSVDIVFSRGVDYVFHLAALKHVPICENMPIEAIKTNITGTINLVQAAIKYKVKKFIDVSTDKAVAPSNLYGMTKAVGEKIVLQANNLTNDTHFSCVRGGNVLGSNGSVVPHFINQIKKQNRITITNNDMTRYFLTLNDAIKLLFQATSRCVGGEIFVMNMPAFYISDLAKIIVENFGDEDTKIDVIGIREGEKMHEELISEHEAKKSYVLNNDYYVILPSISINRNYSYIINYTEKVNFNHFASNDNIKDKGYLYTLLNKGNFLN